MLRDRYLLGELLGRGGMGEVRAGRDLRLDREVAVKLLRREMAVQPGVRERFESEARSAARLVHPHVVAVFDSAEEGGIPFLVMERLVGRTLADVIEEGPMDPAAVRRLGIQVLAGLAAAHQAGLLHRDIKPANILLAGPGDWKIADFGIAKSIESTGDRLTATGLIIGTPAYLPPERLAGGEATAGGDVYAVGVVLYEALIGPRRLNAMPPALPAQPFAALHQRPDLPADLVAVVTRAVDVNPAARFSTALEMATALAGPIPPATTVATDAVATQVLSGPRPLRSLPQQVSRSVRHRRTMLGVVAASILVAAIIATMALGRHPSPAGPHAPTATTVPAVSPTTLSPGPVLAVPPNSVTTTPTAKKTSADHGKRDRQKPGG
jgi:serine/threonine protein kinase